MIRDPVLIVPESSSCLKQILARSWRRLVSRCWTVPIAFLISLLAAQKGDGGVAQASNQQGTPPVPHPSSTPSGYQAPYPVPTPPSNTGTYSFPPPSSTGNFDLSSIKPASSGAVNFDDGSARRSGGDRHASYDQSRGGGSTCCESAVAIYRALTRA
jgi:hypothetical protein